MVNGSPLGTIRMLGPEKQRDAEGEDALLYWVIVNIRFNPRGYRADSTAAGGGAPMLKRIRAACNRSARFRCGEITGLLH